MVDDYIVAIAAIPTTLGDSNITAIRCLDGRTNPGAKIDAGVTTPEALVDRATGRPGEVTTADAGAGRRGAAGIGSNCCLLGNVGLDAARDNEFHGDRQGGA